MIAALARRSEDELRAWSAAERDAHRAWLADLPDAAEVARVLPLNEATALHMAYPAQGTLVAQSEAEAKLLRPWGLVDAGTGNRKLTAFGIAVRRVLVGEG